MMPDELPPPSAMSNATVKLVAEMAVISGTAGPPALESLVGVMNTAGAAVNAVLKVTVCELAGVPVAGAVAEPVNIWKVVAPPVAVNDPAAAVTFAVPGAPLAGLTIHDADVPSVPRILLLCPV